MTAQTTQAPATCKCGCGRELARGRGDGHGYANACRKRWDRQGRPAGGPRPSNRDIASARLAQLETMFADGVSYATAAAALGVPLRTVERVAGRLNQRKREQGADEGGDLVPARPLPAVTHWSGRAACRGHQDLFFGPDGERIAERQAREEMAKALCGVCPVTRECREFAVQQGFRDGVWGGVSEGDREREARNRRNAARRVPDDARRRAAGRREQDELAEAS